MIFDPSFFDQELNRKNTHSAKWDSLGREDMLPFSVADMDFRCLPSVSEVLCRRAQHPSFGYSSGDEEGAQAFCAFWQRRHGLMIRPEQTVMLPCVVTGLKLAVRVLTQKGDKIAVMTPVYPPFYGSVTDNGREVVKCPLVKNAEGRYDIDFDLLESVFKNGVKALLLCNPHNPVSRCWRKHELETLIELAEKYGVYIVSDEIHADFVYKPLDFVPALSLPGASARVISLVSASKTFNLAGMQQSQLVCFDQELMEKFKNEIRASGITSGNIFAMYAAREVYKNGDAWLDGLLYYLDGSRNVLKKTMSELLPEVEITPIEATYLAWLDFSAFNKTASQLTELFKQAGVSVVPGTGFGAEGEGRIRFNFGCPRKQMLEGVERMNKAIRGE